MAHLNILKGHPVVLNEIMELQKIEILFSLLEIITFVKAEVMLSFQSSTVLVKEVGK